MTEASNLYFPNPYMMELAYENRVAPEKKNLLILFTGSSDSTKDGWWYSTEESPSSDIDSYERVENLLLDGQTLSEGDLFYWDATNNRLARIAIGTDGQILTVVSGAWEAADSGGGLGSDDITNDSGVSGATVSDALDTLNGAVGGSVNADAIPRVILQGSSSSVALPIDWTWNVAIIPDTDFWTTANRTRLLVPDATKDYAIEVHGNLYNTSGSDGQAQVSVKRYNSSNTLQSTYYLGSIHVFDNTVNEILFTTPMYRIAASAISAGDYFVVNIDSLGSGVDVSSYSKYQCKYYQMTAI